MSAIPRISLAFLLTLSFGGLALAGGCAPGGPTYVDQGTHYTLASVDGVFSSADTRRYTDRPTSAAVGLRHDALVALRKRGGNAASAAELVTRTFPADTRSVPVYVERATVENKPALVIVEATGPKEGTLKAKRLWVLDNQGNVIFASTGK